MSTIKVQFKITDEARQAYTVRTGRVLAGTDVVLLNVDELTAEERAAIIPVLGLPYSENHVVDLQYAPYKLTVVPETTADWVAIAGGLTVARKAQNAETNAREATKLAEVMERVSSHFNELEALNDAELRRNVRNHGYYPYNTPGGTGKAFADREAALKARLEAYEPIWLAAQAAYQVFSAKANAEREAAEQAETEAKQAERQAWIDEHGSDFLKKAVNAGYDCQRRYVTERAAIEHLNAIVDFNDNAKWRSRSCPSEEALDLALKAGGTVVWLTIPPHTQEQADWAFNDFEACEAVVVGEFLGKYDVIYTSF